MFIVKQTYVNEGLIKRGLHFRTCFRYQISFPDFVAKLVTESAGEPQKNKKPGFSAFSLRFTLLRTRNERSSRAIASHLLGGFLRVSARQRFESTIVMTRLVEPVPKMRCDCPERLPALSLLAHTEPPTLRDDEVVDEFNIQITARFAQRYRNLDIFG